MPRACPEPGDNRSRRGGRRLGAGAPRGNMNALKHGLRSRQFAQLGAVLAASPAAREALFALAERHRVKQRSADQLAAYILSQIIARGLKRGQDRLIVLPPVEACPEPSRRDRHSINETAAPDASPEPVAGDEKENAATHNLAPDTKPADQSARRYKKELD
jgi:hypothetical protein